MDKGPMLTDERLKEIEALFASDEPCCEYCDASKDLLAAIRRERKECERLRKTLMGLAKTRGCSEKDNAGERHYFCNYCEGRGSCFDDIGHDSTCPTRIAADALKGEA